MQTPPLAILVRTLVATYAQANSPEEFIESISADVIHLSHEKSKARLMFENLTVSDIEFVQSERATHITFKNPLYQGHERLFEHLSSQAVGELDLEDLKELTFTLCGLDTIEGTVDGGALREDDQYMLEQISLMTTPLEDTIVIQPDLHVVSS